MEEIWKDIENFEGLYQVSNLGNIKSFPKKGSYKTIIMKPFIVSGKKTKGYYGIELRKNSKRFPKLVHRLVAETFIPNPNNLLQVNHINGNRLDNRVDNLEWCTQSDNIKHAYKNGLMKPKFGKNNGWHTEILQYDLQGNFIKEWSSISEAKKQLGINNITNACSGKYKKAGGYIWKYKHRKKVRNDNKGEINKNKL